MTDPIEGLASKAERLRAAIADEKAKREAANRDAAKAHKKAQLEAEVAALEAELEAEKAITKAQGAPEVVTAAPVPTENSTVVADATSGKKKEN